MQVKHSADKGILTVYQEQSFKPGTVTYGTSTFQPNLFYQSCYMFVRALEDIKQGEYVFIKTDNTASKTKQEQDVTLGVCLINVPKDTYFFVGLKGAYKVPVAEAIKNSVVYFNASENALTSNAQDIQLQGSYFLSDSFEEDEQTKAIILIRGE